MTHRRLVLLPVTPNSRVSQTGPVPGKHTQEVTIALVKRTICAVGRGRLRVGAALDKIRPGALRGRALLAGDWQLLPRRLSHHGGRVPGAAALERRAPLRHALGALQPTVRDLGELLEAQGVSDGYAGEATRVSKASCACREVASISGSLHVWQAVLVYQSEWVHAW